MTIIVMKTLVPYNKIKSVAKKFVEVTKQYPPDKSLEKQILRVAARSTPDGVESIAVTNVKEGKYNEFMKRLNRVQMEYFDVEGKRFTTETYLSEMDALSLLGLELP